MTKDNKFLSRDFFNFLLSQSPVPNNANLELLYKVYCITLTSIVKNITTNQVFDSESLINPLAVWNYIVAEYMYSTRNMEEKDIQLLHQIDGFVIGMSNVCIDKYLTLEHLSYIMTSTANKYYPPLSSLELYLNNVLRILAKLPSRKIPNTLLNDIFLKYFTMCHCIVELLSKGFETEALATWRTVHETECILIILNKYPETLDSYIKHMTYNLAYRNSIIDLQEQDKIFEQLKGEMKALGLKSKDMKRYIENGWLYAIEGIKDDPTFKINFRMGIEYVAGLEDLNEWYEISSEIAHGSPLLVYSDKRFFFNMTLVGTLESFVRIEELFAKTVNEQCDDATKQAYNKMREVRLTEIKKILNIEKTLFETTSEHIINSIYHDDRSEIDKTIE